VKKLVQMHDGSVEAHSDGPGHGSEFQVRLPILIGAASRTPVEDEYLGQSNVRVLIVDDKHDAASSLAMLVQKLGNEVFVAHDGLKAVELAGKLRPDVVLMDIGMPQLNGYEAARQMREQPWAHRLVLIALTGWGQEEDKQRAQEAGFDHHLIKPLDIASLKMLLAQITGRKEPAKAN